MNIIYKTLKKYQNNIKKQTIIVLIKKALILKIILISKSYFNLKK